MSLQSSRHSVQMRPFVAFLRIFQTCGIYRPQKSQGFSSSANSQRCKSNCSVAERSIAKANLETVSVHSLQIEVLGPTTRGLSRLRAFLQKLQTDPMGCGCLSVSVVVILIKESNAMGCTK